MCFAAFEPFLIVFCCPFPPLPRPHFLTPSQRASASSSKRPPCMQVLGSMQGAVDSLTCTFTSELRALRDPLRAQGAEYISFKATLMHHVTQELASLKLIIETQHSEYAAFRAELMQRVTQELSALREAFTQEASEFAAVQSALTEQVAEMKTTCAIQHDSLVDVRAALHAVCAQFEAFKSTPAAVAKHVQALGLQRAGAVKSVVAEIESKGKTLKGQAGSRKVR